MAPAKKVRPAAKRTTKPKLDGSEMLYKCIGKLCHGECNKNPIVTGSVELKRRKNAKKAPTESIMNVDTVGSVSDSGKAKGKLNKTAKGRVRKTKLNVASSTQVNMKKGMEKAKAFMCGALQFGVHAGLLEPQDSKGKIIKVSTKLLGKLTSKKGKVNASKKVAKMTGAAAGDDGSNWAGTALVEYATRSKVQKMKKSKNTKRSKKNGKGSKSKKMKASSKRSAGATKRRSPTHSKEVDMLSLGNPQDDVAEETATRDDESDRGKEVVTSEEKKVNSLTGVEEEEEEEEEEEVNQEENASDREEQLSATEEDNEESADQNNELRSEGSSHSDDASEDEESKNVKE